MNHVLAIAEKDFKEFMKNMMLLTMPILPIIMALLFQRLFVNLQGDERDTIVILVVMLSFGSILTISMMTMFTEENEKHTLRGLVNSPTTLFDIIVGKSVVVTLITAVTIAIILFIFKTNIFNSFYMIIGGILSAMFFLLIGIAIGLNVKTVAMTSLYTIPILFIFVMSDMFESLFANKNILTKIMTYTPATQYRLLYTSGDIKHILIMSLWVAVCIIFTLWSFRKVSIDK